MQGWFAKKENYKNFKNGKIKSPSILRLKGDYSIFQI